MKYPRFFALILTIIIAVLIFNNEKVMSPENFLVIESYLSSFTLGVLYVYGFTAALSTGALLAIADQQNVFITGFIAGLGALMGDLIIFKFVRKTFNNEIKKLQDINGTAGCAYYPSRMLMSDFLIVVILMVWRGFENE